MKESKKQKIREVLKYYVSFLMLEEYRVYPRFKTSKEDPEVKGNLAVIHIDEEKKVLYLKLNRHLFNRMKMREIKRYLLHELLHSFFGELSIFFFSVMNEAGFSAWRKKVLANRFDALEHKKINHLIDLMLSLDNKKRISEKRY